MRRCVPGIAGLWVVACSGSDVTVSKQEAELIVSPTFIDMGVLEPGSETPYFVTLQSTKGEINLLALDLANVEGEAFELSDPLPESVVAGTPVDLELTYAPIDEARHWARFVIRSDANNTEEIVEIRGESAFGRFSLRPTLVDFGRVPAGETATGTISVQNEGAAPATVDAIEVSGTGFALETSLPIELAAGEIAEIEVSFSPTDDESAEGEALVVLNEDRTVRLIGNDCSSGGGGPLYDRDGDGSSWCADDCDDTDASARPGGTEACDGVDNDCDGVVDEDTSCFDDDGDGFSEDDGDCNDTDDAVGPEAVEVLGNGVDDDCDGVADDGAGDVDGDGVTTAGGDCNDGNAAIRPGAAETANGLDDDCDGVIDEGTSAYDDDGDGYTEVAGDCDDGDASISPGAVEIANRVDDDCDGSVDEGTSYADADGDGWTGAAGDCDDADASVNPGEVEIAGDGVDNDCDGSGS